MISFRGWVLTLGTVACAAAWLAAWAMVPK